MHTVQRSVLVPYTAAQMFDLVDKVADYPKFMPWCGGASERNRTATSVEGSVTIQFAGLKQTFTTHNTLNHPHSIDLALVDGPFSSLTGRWEFLALAEDACKVVFTLEYAFASRTVEAIIGPVFNRIATSFIDAFTKRADELYG